MIDIIIAVVLVLMFVGLMVFLSVWGFKKAKAQKKRKIAIEKRLDATLSGVVKHISGLPVAKGVIIELYYGPKQIVFKKDGQEFVISRDKITNIDLVIQGNSGRKAMSGAAAGKYVLGGTTGAVVGSLSALVPNLVISYESDGKTKQITLDPSSSGTLFNKIEKDFKRTTPYERNTVEL